MREFIEHGHGETDIMFEDHRGEGSFIHESSYIDSPCRIGKQTAILHFTHVMSHAMIGDHCHIGHHVTIASGVLIGNHVRVMNNVLLNSGVILEDSVYCGPSTVFAPLTRLRGKHRALSRVSPTLVRECASIGPNSAIAAGVTIGRHSFIEAGTVVDRNIPDFALVCGNPFKFRGWRCVCGELLRFDDNLARCHQCGDVYLRQARNRITQGETPDAARCQQKK